MDATANPDMSDSTKVFGPSTGRFPVVLIDHKGSQGQDGRMSPEPKTDVKGTAKDKLGPHTRTLVESHIAGSEQHANTIVLVDTRDAKNHKHSTQILSKTAPSNQNTSTLAHKYYVSGPTEIAGRSARLGVNFTFWSFCYFFVMLACVGLAEGIVLYLCLDVSSTAPLAVMFEAASKLEAALVALTTHKGPIPPLNMVKEFMAQGAAFTTTQAKVVAQAERIFWLQFGITAVALVIVLVAACLAVWFRHLPIVKSRGKWPLWHCLVAGVLLLTSDQILVAVHTFRFVDMGPAKATTFPGMLAELRERSTQLSNQVCIATTITLTSVCIFVGSVVQRQWLLCQVFLQTLKGRATALSYLAPFPLHLLVGLLSSTSFIVWRLHGYNYYTSTWKYTCGLWTAPLIYSGMLAYYTVKMGKRYPRFNDYYCNIRVLLVHDLILAVVQVLANTHPDSLLMGCLGWTIAARTLVVTYVLDQIICLAMQLCREQRPGSLQRGEVVAVTMSTSTR